MIKGAITRSNSMVSSKVDSQHQPLLDDMNGNVTVNVNGATNSQLSMTQSQETVSLKFGVPVKQYKSVKWAMIIAVVLMWMQQLSGINAIMFYCSTILGNAGIKSEEGKWLGTTGVNFANFLGVFIPVFLIDRAGRRVLLVISSIIMIIASVGASVAILMNDSNNSGGGIWGYLSIVFLAIFVVGFETGMGPIPWLMMAELSPMQYRGVIVSVATAMNWSGSFLIAQFSEMIMNSPIKLFGFAVATFMGIFFTLRFIPETNGKTAAEIARALGNI